MSALLRQLSKPDLMEESVAAENPEQVIAILSSESTSPDMATVSALFAGGQDGAEPAAQILARTPPAYLAELVEDLTPADRSQFLAKLDPVRAAQVVDQMHLIPAAAAIRRMSSEASARILGYVEIAHCAVILRQLNPEEQAAILKHLTARERTGVQTVLKYPPSTAGGIMTPEVLSVKEDATVADALNAMASFPDRRQIDIYVINSQGRLAGKCLIHDLLGVQPHAKISAVMQQNMTTVQPERDQEELRHMVARSDLRSMPVVGPQGNLLGVVTEDDILDVVEQEAGEDIALMVGVKMVDPIHTPIQTRIRMRLPWLLLTLGGELFIALVISKFFSSTLERAVVLAAFIPAIMATGGNVGLQSTTMVIRGLGMGTLKPKHTWRLISGEVKLGFLTGLGCGLIAALVAYLINWNYHEVLKVSFSVFLAMVSATFATSLIGTLEPIVLHRLKFDPATACGPFVTMFNDMFGSIVYLLIASFMHFSPP
ncbi:MAG: magnesium transporter [Elusimicrobia bacterium RIFCSPHIGHO2_02_FULL_61_10]|nr:MAG: magnesium transporter [Elusimicrobia bacterium RIFCSPHIGHO2_02_FULL_61_10]